MRSLTVLIIVVQISEPVMAEPPAGRFVAEGSPQLVQFSIGILHNYQNVFFVILTIDLIPCGLS
jgi:hypothetical protein